MSNLGFKRVAMFALLCAMMVMGTQAMAADDKPFAEKKIVLQISDGNPFKQTLILNVANNLLREYGADKVAIEVVAFGPGVRLLFKDNVNKERIQGLDASGVKFTACSNTIKNMTKKLGHRPDINALAKQDSPGVVRIAKLVTEEGYTLVKP
jgi:intracellular sulfur oxidation DsrE/DsrF family protein